MTSEELKTRTKKFALRIIKLAISLPHNDAAIVIGKQVLRSATSVGANYRSSQRSRSHDEFISKLKIAEEEADETVYWLELLAESEIVKAELLKDLMKEANEITAILTVAGKTAKRNKQLKKQ